jgi:AraC-like DNA-binding protein
VNQPLASQSLNNPIPAERSFLAARSRSTRWDYWIHAHPCFELIHIRSVSVYSVVGDAQGVFEADQLLLLAPGVPHSFYTAGFIPHGEAIEMRLVYFSPDLVDGARTPELADLGPMLARARRGLRFTGHASAEAASLIDSVVDLGATSESAALLLRALARLAREPEARQIAEHETSSRFRGEEMARLDGLRAIVRRRFREPLTLEDVAGEAGMSASTVNHLLKKYLKVTFLEHLSGIRLDHAKHLLATTDADITEIAFAAGFGSLATFNRRFRDSQKQAPHEYREARR